MVFFYRAFLFGLCWGSFFNVCIWRIPRKESVVFAPSHCPNCNASIKWFDNIPLLSYLILGGKCRCCKIKISPRYFIVELVTGLLFLIDYQRVCALGQHPSTLLMYIFATSLLIMTFLIDIKHKIIPDKINYTITILALLTALAFPQSVGKETHLAGFLNSLCGALVSIAILGVFSIGGKILFKKEIMGWGDVKYLGAIGACFGFIPAVWFFTLFAGSILGMIYGFSLILLRRKSILSEVPFGPFLAVGTYLWILHGTELTNGYFTLISTLLQ